MCYRTSAKTDVIKIKKRFNLDFKNPELFHGQAVFNGFDHPLLPVIANNSFEYVQMAEWGLIPETAQHEPKAFRKNANTLNAKIETLTTTPSFRPYVAKRCLVIVDSFYEYKWLDGKGKRKLLHQISMPGEDLFTLAGIYSEIHNHSGSKLITYSIVTTEANTLMAEVHNSKKRMPVVLHRDEEQLWLNEYPIANFVNRSEIELHAVPLLSDKDAQLDLFE